MSDSNVVDGTYAIYHLDVDTTLRLPGLLKTLAQGRFVELPAPDDARSTTTRRSWPASAASTPTSR